MSKRTKISDNRWVSYNGDTLKILCNGNEVFSMGLTCDEVSHMGKWLEKVGGEYKSEEIRPSRNLREILSSIPMNKVNEWDDVTMNFDIKTLLPDEQFMLLDLEVIQYGNQDIKLNDIRLDGNTQYYIITSKRGKFLVDTQGHSSPKYMTRI